MNVFFDNLQVVHTRSPILEETHYYPFGLTMAGISSKALAFGSPQNKYKFNGIEQNNDFDLNMYDAFYRNLDPQIGRFWQPDPITSHSESVYASMQNNPISKADWLGDYFTWANSTVEDTYNRLRKENNKRLEGYMKELSGLDLKSSDKKVQKQIKQLEALINAHGDLNSQWNEMEKSDVEFHVSSETAKEGASGDTGFSGLDNRVNVRLGKSDKSIGLMAHELRHGYGYLNGELMYGPGGLWDITDEVAGYKVKFLFLDRNTANLVADGYYNVEWFKEGHLKSDLYKHLSGKEVSITINTPAAVYMKYFNDRLVNFIPQGMKNNANLTVKDAMDIVNRHSQQQNRGNEYRYGEQMLKNRNQ